MSISVFDKAENTGKKEYKARSKHVLLFPQCFQNLLSVYLKPRTVFINLNREKSVIISALVGNGLKS